MRVPVPDAFREGDRISLAGTNDHHYGDADVNLESVRNARTVRVERDDGGLHVRVNDNHADAVAAYLADEYDADVSVGDVSTRSESESKPEPDTCEVVKADGEVCGRELPCPYHSDGED